MNVHPREKILRALIVAVAVDAPLATGASLAPRWILPAFVATLFIVLGGVAGGIVVVFYATWILGWLTEMSGNSPNLLIGEASFDVPQPYWPWSRRIKALRARKRIAALEASVGLGRDGTFGGY